jgi:hypothetical protein
VPRSALASSTTQGRNRSKLPLTIYARAVALERSNPSQLYVRDLQTLSQLLRKLNRPNEAQQYDQERQQAIDHLMRAGATASPAK